MLCDHRAMAIEDYGFLLSNPKSPPSPSLYQKKTENQEKSDSRGRKSDFFSGFENQWTLLLWEPKSDYLSGNQRAISCSASLALAEAWITFSIGRSGS